MSAVMMVGCSDSKQSDTPSWQVDEERELRELLASIKPSPAKLPQLNPLDTSNQDCEPTTPYYPSMCEWMLGVDDLVIAEVVEVQANDSYYNSRTGEIVNSTEICLGITENMKIKVKTLRSLRGSFNGEFIYIGQQSYWTNYPRYNEETGLLANWYPNSENYVIKEGFTIIFPVYHSKTYGRWTTSSEVLLNVTRIGDDLMVNPQQHLPATCIQINIPIEPLNLRTGFSLLDFLNLYQQCADLKEPPAAINARRIQEPRIRAEDPAATYSACYPKN